MIGFFIIHSNWTGGLRVFPFESFFYNPRVLESSRVATNPYRWTTLRRSWGRKKKIPLFGRVEQNKNAKKKKERKKDKPRVAGLEREQPRRRSVLPRSRSIRTPRPLVQLVSGRRPSRIVCNSGRKNSFSSWSSSLFILRTTGLSLFISTHTFQLYQLSPVCMCVCVCV